MLTTAKQTKIVCTVGPASHDVAVLKKMIKAGMNVARLNFSHGTHADHAKLIKTVRAAAAEAGEPVATLQDLSGPKMRVGDLPEKGIVLKVGQEVDVAFGKAYGGTVIPVSYPYIHTDIRPGEQVLLDDGLMELRALRVNGKVLRCKVVVGGTLLSHKGFNVPTSKLRIDTITAKDKDDVLFGLRQGVDWVSLSFVRSADDIRNLKSLIKRAKNGGLMPKILAKIEKKEALDDLENIVKEVDGIMIARGDLAIETKAEEVPVRQKEIIEMCLRYGRPVIVATEMMASMAKNPRPTRAELSDVGHAVMDHADAVMTSGETATGAYPVLTVDTMAKIAQSTEKSVFDDYPLELHAKHRHTRDRIVGITARLLVEQTKAAAIGFLPGNESMARLASHFRTPVPLVVGVKTAHEAQQLNLWWGMHGVVVSGRNAAEFQKQLLGWMREHGIRAGATVAFLSAEYRPEDARFSLQVEEKTISK
ncbi:pyruvate kinase [Candidatus Uhrbacteria bacterium RIFCSPLOWO2_02_FULL_51_9]|uniref:Pyruvate kinase n=1 Tax=Candidatus Uhrbacteria bacterium RIFCSPLOWO2_02_FULL_51_9 TaxID=1802410 RepID=A0A1F7VE54_9BACT|nr:MAG: pyruvate kinase [Candidatus Uhrbacteria bacterium RIFCSPLOWO2_02_FULL_51_9]